MLQGYHSVVALDASDKNRTGGLKLCLSTDSLFRCSERPTETVRKCRTQFRNVSFLSKKRKYNRSHHTAFVSDTTVYMEDGKQVWALCDVCDFHAVFVWLSWLYMDRYLPTFWWLFLQLNRPLYLKAWLHHTFGGRGSITLTFSPVIIGFNP